MGAIIALGTAVALILALIMAIDPAGAIVGITLTTAVIVLVLLAYLWLDRWEPEPPRLLVFAFLWGASVAVIVSIVLELVFEQAINPAATVESDSSALTVALGAPLITALCGVLGRVRTLPHGPSMCVASLAAVALAAF